MNLDLGGRVMIAIDVTDDDIRDGVPSFESRAAMRDGVSQRACPLALAINRHLDDGQDGGGRFEADVIDNDTVAVFDGSGRDAAEVVRLHLPESAECFVAAFYSGESVSPICFLLELPVGILRADHRWRRVSVAS